MSGWTVKTMPLVAPSVGVLLIWMIVPLVMTVLFSFRRYNLVNPMLHGWAGTRNYYYLLTDPALYSALVDDRPPGRAGADRHGLRRHAHRGSLQREIPGSGHRPRSRHLAILRHAHGQRADLEEHDDAPGQRAVRLLRARLVGLQPIDWFGQLPLTSIIIICSWEWIPFAFLILLTALQSLDEEQKEAARIDGAGPISMFFYIIVPHLRRATSVVIMIETIFFLTIFAEIYVTTSGGPGVVDHQHRLPDLQAGALGVQRGHGVGCRRHRHHPGQHRGGLPGPHGREEPRDMTKDY